MNGHASRTRPSVVAVEKGIDWPAAAMPRLFAAYMLVSAAALLFPARQAHWPGLALLHLVAAVLAWRAGNRAGDSQDRLALTGHESSLAGEEPVGWKTWLLAALPLLLVPFLYAELAGLNQAVHGGRYFDAWIVSWESSLFGEPSRTLARTLPGRWLSEVLHASYVSYYLIIYGPPLLLFRQRRLSEFRAAVFTLLLVFFAHYLFFIYLPVQGPRYLYSSPVPATSQGPVYQLTHWLLERGSSQGAAFPSSHAGVAAAQLVATLRYLPSLAIPVGLLTLGLTVGAVYGGFHYATDMAAGLILGFALAWSAPACARLIAGRPGA